jgi:DNA-binding beta-propeller fold protein YncE
MPTHAHPLDHDHANPLNPRWRVAPRALPRSSRRAPPPSAVAPLLLTLLAGLLALGHGRPGAAENLAVPAAASQPSPTPAVTAKPVAEFLWQADGSPGAPLINPAGAAVDPQGNLWVTDGFHGWFVIFSPDGDVLETWGTLGSGEGEFNFNCGEGYGGVAFDAAGNIYVADAGNGRIQKFGPDRAFITSWRGEAAPAVDDTFLATGRGNKGVANPLTLCPAAIALDRQGRVFVSERTTGQIVVFDADGNPLATATTTSMRPESVAVDSNGNIWAADNFNRVLKFSPQGALLASWDNFVPGAGDLKVPMGLALDAENRVFVADQGNRVQVFAPDGTFIGAWGSSGIHAGQFTDPVGLALDGAGHIYVIEHYGHRVQKFRLLPPLGS